MNCKGWSVERGFPATAKKPGRGPAIHEAGNGMRANGPTHKQVGMGVCVHYCSTYYKAVRVGWGGEGGGHVLRETTSRGLRGLVCPSRVVLRTDHCTKISCALTY